MKRLPASMLLVAIVVAVFLLVIVALPRRAAADPRTDCPSPAPCKVITLSPEEEQALTGQKMVFDTAVAGRQIDLFGVVAYFREKIGRAPAGDAAKPVEAKPAEPQSSVAK